MKDSFSFQLPTRIHFGAGALSRLSDCADGLGRKAFLITGRGSARENGSLARCTEALHDPVVYEGIDENPTDADCDLAAAACRDAHCDLIVALGGGSPTDVAKAVALLARNDGPCSEYFGTEQYSKEPLPIIAIPTTAGAGSELTPYSVLVSASERTKRTIGGFELFPRHALVDPELTLSLPRSVTLASGLDALSQGIEGILSNRSTPMSDLLAVETIRLAVTHIPIVAEQPENTAARSAMAYGAMLSGAVVAQTGTTLVHGMGYQYTVEHGMPHGIANALLLPPMLRYNAKVAPERTAAVAAAWGLNSTAPNTGAELANALVRLLERLGVPPAARDHGLPEAEIDRLAERVSDEPRRFRHERGTPDREDVRRFYRESFLGTEQHN